MGLREQILEADDINHEDVEVPEWGVTIRVQSPNVRERARIVSASMNQKTGRVDLEKMYPSLVVAMAVDPDTGEHLFTDKDTDALLAKSGAAVERVAQAAMRVAGLGENPVEQGKGG